MTHDSHPCRLLPLTTTPLPAPQVQRGGYYYATLDLIDYDQTSVGCQSSRMPLPDPEWEVVPGAVDRVVSLINEHPWGTPTRPRSDYPHLTRAPHLPNRAGTYCITLGDVTPVPPPP